MMGYFDQLKESQT